MLSEKVVLNVSSYVVSPPPLPQPVKEPRQSKRAIINANDFFITVTSSVF